MTTTQIQMLDYALTYAARGWQLLALHTPCTDGSCSCGKADCDSIGKHPRWDRQLLPNGLKSATTDPAVIRVWWSLWPDANIGIVTGMASGFWALDKDIGTGGDLSLEQLLAQYGPLPETPEQRTGSGGAHILFAHTGTPIGNRVRFAPGLDTRGDGGYIVAAPSLHASGQRYDWTTSPDDVPLAEAPAWLLAVIAPPQKHTPASPGIHSTSNGHANLPKRTLTYLFAGAPQGSRNTELYAAAQQFKAAGYGQAEADKKLRTRAQQDGLSDSEIDKTIASAYASQQVSGPATAPTASQQAPSQGSASNQKHSAWLAAMLRALGYSFRLNLCNNTIEVNGEALSDELRARIRTDARDAGLKPLGAVEDVCVVEAIRNAYHPVRDYLNGLVWDGKPHIARLSALLHGSDPPVIYQDGTSAPLIHVYLWRWLIGAVAKVYTGTQNMMLVLAGPQSIGKSLLARWLCPLPDYFLEAPINVNDKDTYVRLISRFVWEVSELDATTRKADVAALKAFITEEQVTVRKAYGRHDTVRPALASLIGTVNQSTGFLSDDTGNRRFLVATIEAIDWSYIQLNIDQIWAEAVAAYQRGEPHRLTPEERAVQDQQNRLHETESILEDWIISHFILGATNAQMTAGDIINHLRERYDIRLNGSERMQAMELSRVLTRLGVQKIRTNSWRGYQGIMPK